MSAWTALPAGAWTYSFRADLCPEPLTYFLMDVDMDVLADLECGGDAKADWI